MRIDINALRRQIDGLLAAHPELAEDQDLLRDMVEGETEAFEILSRLVCQAGEAKALSFGVAEYIKELGERKARFDRRVDGIRALVVSVMEAAGIDKAILPEATLSIRAGNSKAVVDDASLLPDDLVRIERKPDMAAIKAAVEVGREVAGIHISNGEPSLTVRVR
ncbi:siphovirus Gp157 family protein [Ancylobacter oerskovii]|uniref:Siphovirus Gp157 family protein n=1 Tax=Ancylobacter oerskovii TaxID=459519 RepID=A0ABW4Z171_9HYPH|nr:siphovirus Gp157 family protein [Ancylobacter oerskovii]MBS7545092.1 siphovirus Gp157 family protein [Ancylobacter oerskovii]